VFQVTGPEVFGDPGSAKDSGLEAWWRKHLEDHHGVYDSPADHEVETYGQLHSLLYPDADWCVLYRDKS
jgi:hypothetical protein